MFRNSLPGRPGRVLFVSAALAALVATVGMLSGRDEASAPIATPTTAPRPQAPPPRRTDAELRQLREELDALTDDHDALAETVQELDKAPAEADAPPVDPVAAGIAAAEAQLHILKGRFDLEPADPEWSGDAESALHSRFAEAAPEGTTLSAAECRADMCRLQFEFAGADTREAGMRDIPFLLPWSGEAFFSVDPDTGLSATIYVAR